MAVLFVDLVGSTQLAAENPPQEVVARLNEFFGVVVEVVEDHGGWINKFEGDAALAVFGAPLPLDDAAGCALKAARELAERLARARRPRRGHRRLRRPGRRGQRGGGDALRVHGDRRPGQRGRAAVRAGQGVRRPRAGLGARRWSARARTRRRAGARASRSSCAGARRRRRRPRPPDDTYMPERVILTAMHGTYETIEGRPAVRFERRLAHPVDAVWRAVTERDQLAHWFPTEPPADGRHHRGGPAAAAALPLGRPGRPPAARARRGGGGLRADADPHARRARPGGA